MESTVPPIGEAAPIDDLSPLFEQEGPFLTAVLETDGDVAQAADLSVRRWAAGREQAAAGGAPEEALAAVDELVPDAHLDGPRLFVVATGSGVAHAEPLGEPADPFAGWSPLPSLVPLVADRQNRLPHVVARCDRAGADLDIVEMSRAHAEATVSGRQWPITKAGAGGWSHRRYHERAEQTWDDNAAGIAEAVAAQVRRIEAGLVVLTGDEGIVAQVAGHLEGTVEVRTAPGGRGADGSDETVDDHVRRLVATVAAERTTELVAAFRDRRGQGQACEGPEATLAALAAAQVGQLLVHDHGDGEPAATFEDAGGGRVEARLCDVAVRAAVLGSATVHAVPAHGGPAGGIGGLLRWT